MQEFVVIIHRDLTSENPSPSPEEMKLAIKPYLDWISKIEEQGKLVRKPKRWDLQGRIISNGITGKSIGLGPFVNGKKSIGGLICIYAKDYNEAVQLAEECPIIQFGAVVEVRMAYRSL